MSTASRRRYDILVVGAGHAGCEAALAGARMGARTALITTNADHVGHLPCNCSIGGPAKAHLAREVDALGGEMGRNTDETYTHIRMLNTSRGPAVQALRAQVDIQRYAERLKQVLQAQDGLTVAQGEVSEITMRGSQATGVLCTSGEEWRAGAVIVTAGTFLNGIARVGELSFAAGRAGDPPAVHLSAWYRRHGFSTGRLKTGTVPRVHRESLALDEVTVQPADPTPCWFSFENTGRPRRERQMDCWATHTTAETARIARENLSRSALYGGHIEGIGPRYCPSIEDKFVKFPDRSSHHVYLEQEGWDCGHVYVAGLSNSFPPAVQVELLRSVPGLRHADMVRPGYAIEYDFIPPTQLTPALETKRLRGLFHAGQINGTSGYEEAAAQGLLAAINAQARLCGSAPLVLTRAEAYTGVLIDDLVTKGTDEPYRMFTSRAEFRLLLRQDNADRRLTKYGWKRGLVSAERWDTLRRKQEAIRAAIERATTTRVPPTDAVNARLAAMGSAPLRNVATVAQIIRRPEISFASAWEAAGSLPELDLHTAREVEAELKYEGYLQRQEDERARFAKQEGQRLPEALDYSAVVGLRTEARHRLSQVRPRSLGQAARVQGVTPADISVLAVHVHRLGSG